MEFGDVLKIGEQQSPPLRFLLIGGYAVNAYGYTRATFDIDFLVRREDLIRWKEALARNRFAVFQESENFLQFARSGNDPLDLMLVREETFARFWAASECRMIGIQEARVPALDHLLALKLHALKQGLRHRTFKDADDVETLVRVNKIDLNSERYEQLFLKYGTREIYDTIRRIAGQ